jgi:hypothetical protein
MLKKSPAGTAAMTEIKNQPSRRFGGEHAGPQLPVAAGLGTIRGALGTAVLTGGATTGGVMVTTVGGTTVGEEVATGVEDGKETGLGVGEGVAAGGAGGVAGCEVRTAGVGSGSS